MTAGVEAWLKGFEIRGEGIIQSGVRESIQWHLIVPNRNSLERLDGETPASGKGGESELAELKDLEWVHCFLSGGRMAKAEKTTTANIEEKWTTFFPLTEEWSKASLEKLQKLYA